MSLTEILPVTVTSLVEVSGWDEDELFFVEKSELATDDLCARYISLEHRIPDGAIIFVRMLQSTYLHRPNPVAFEAEFLGCDAEGHQQFRLNTAQPRYPRTLYPVN